MRTLPSPRVLLSLSVASLLSFACASPSPAIHTGQVIEVADATSCEEPYADQFACVEEECGVFSCEDVDPDAVARAPLEHGTEFARGFRPPFRSPGSHRNWRRAGLRDDARPRMTFHFRYRHGFLPAFPRLEGKLIRHHLFPQAREFREWFRAHGINVHEWTMVIPEHVHLRVHSGKGRGGLWNEAWRQFRVANEGRRLPKEELIAKAFELAYRYDIVGPITSYNHPIVPPGPQLLAP
ncbi:TIGR02269 family lipoprotein [Hyalangium sp.]|uniref:SitA6 family polymorphic toxin lipoprotein n=1 Tax=Hyalangium sp. TaxID=2028555 RepID=UPI002D3FA1C7|nr:TIGR02269 family lipoprotein [Hyalangium sp.]HYI01124.1 TIGR02269 family lipoprotein [Hyalangium sp.]